MAQAVSLEGDTMDWCIFDSITHAHTRLTTIPLMDAAV